MKNQYFGDIGDYGKYGLLQFLAEHGIRISVNWYLTENDRGTDGKFTEYLENEKFRKYSPGLYDMLKEYVVVREHRDVLVMKEAGLIPNAKYYTEPMPALGGLPADERRRRREEWHQRALAFCRGSNLVFLDPDNGIRQEEISVSPADNKYVLLKEAVEYYEAGLDVVYYCHKGRRTPDQWAAYKNLLRPEVPAENLAGLTYHRGTQRSYIFALQDSSAAQMRQLLDAFLTTKWGVGKEPMFTCEPI